MRFKSYLVELLDSTTDKLELAIDEPSNQVWRLILSPTQRIAFFARWSENGDRCDFYFRDGQDLSLTGKGEEFKVFAAAKKILGEIAKKGPSFITFEADHETPHRARLYKKFLDRWSPPGYVVGEIKGQNVTYFTLRKKLEKVVVR